MSYDIQTELLTPAGKVERAALTIKELPTECTVCHVHTKPQLVGSYGYLVGVKSRGEKVHIPFRCQNGACGSLLIAECGVVYEPSGPRREWAVFRRQVPFAPIPLKIPEVISDLSPLYVEIHQQAEAAKHAGISQLYGMGLRKALEFLIKDYCVSKDKANEDLIKKEFLGTVIKNRVTDHNIRECAARAVWLGNDETHYERRWADKDVTDLERLVTLTVRWIANELETAAYIASMPKP